MSVLSSEDLDLCVQTGLEFGYDVDTCEVQHRHLCWPYALSWGALCGSSSLWFQGGISSESMPVEVPFCTVCLACLAWVREAPPVWRAAVGALACAAARGQMIELAAVNFLLVLDEPDKYASFTSLEQERKDLDEALDAPHADEPRLEVGPTGWILKERTPCP